MSFRAFKYLLISFSIVLHISSCHFRPINQYRGATMTALDSNMKVGDSKIEAIIAPYQKSLDTLVNEVVGYLATPMQVRKPESDLGNLLADYLYHYGVEYVDPEIDLAIFNTGGFRIPLPPGKITLGRVMELMPFDNTLVLKELSGAEMQELAETVIKNGGDPIAAAQSVVLSRDTTGTPIWEINGQVVQANQRYKVLTSSYLADGGDHYHIFKSVVGKKDSGILIRDAIAHSFRKHTSAQQPAIAPIVGRISIPELR